MKPTIAIDTREWMAAAKALKAESNRTLVEFINGQAFRVATLAVKKAYTLQADLAQVVTQLGQIGRVEKIVKKGKRKGEVSFGKRLFKDDSLAARIILKRYNETGQWPVKGNTMEERVREFVNRRIKTIAYVRSGWIPAIQKLDKLVKQKPRGSSKGLEGAKNYKTPKGTARPAKFTLGKIFAEVENYVPGLEPGTDDEATSGLQKALNESARDMREELARRLKEKLKPFGAK